MKPIPHSHPPSLPHSIPFHSFPVPLTVSLFHVPYCIFFHIYMSFMFVLATNSVFNYVYIYISLKQSHIRIIWIRKMMRLSSLVSTYCFFLFTKRLFYYSPDARLLIVTVRVLLHIRLQMTYVPMYVSVFPFYLVPSISKLYLDYPILLSVTLLPYPTSRLVGCLPMSNACVPYRIRTTRIYPCSVPVSPSTSVSAVYCPCPCE